MKRSKNKLLKKTRSILRAVFNFPETIVNMWKNKKLSLVTKTAITGAVLLLLVLIISPFTNPPQRITGGIVPLATHSDVEIEGPDVPIAGEDELEQYTPRRTPMVVETTATPEPIIVYCNIGGKYYHSAECLFAKQETATLQQALAAGYIKCPDCNAPDPVY